jgi:hypothetical protein
MADSIKDSIFALVTDPVRVANQLDRAPGDFECVRLNESTASIRVRGDGGATYYLVHVEKVHR